jgi:hypothetical protein
MLWILQRFHLPEPPRGSDPVWKIESPSRPGRPLAVDLQGIGKVRIFGWLAPVVGSAAMEVLRPAVYLNGQSYEADLNALLPDNAPEVYGALAVLTRRRSLSGPEVIRVCSEVRLQVSRVISQWLEASSADPLILREILEAVLPGSRRLGGGVCLDDPAWREAIRIAYRFPTSAGPMTIEELGTGQVNVTATLHPLLFHRLSSNPFGPIVDMRETVRLAVFKRVSSCDEIVFADVAVARSLTAGEPLGDRDRELQLWFEDGFQRAGSRYREVRVRVLAGRRLANCPALVSPSQHASGFSQWVRTSVLYVSADSELAESIKNIIGQPDGIQAVRHIPLLVHNHALQFSVADYPHEWEMQLWGNVRDLVDLFRHSAELERTIGSQSATREALQEALREIERLRRQIAYLLGLLGLPRDVNWGGADAPATVCI